MQPERGARRVKRDKYFGAGLSPVTLQNYTTRGRSDLVRGVDFFVRRLSPYRRQLKFTQRGLSRLQARDYRVFGEVLAPSRQTVWHGSERLPPIQGSPQERRMRLKQAIAVASRPYFAHPCAIPGCQCSFHALGAPQVEVVRAIMTKKWDGVNRYKPQKPKQLSPL